MLHFDFNSGHYNLPDGLEELIDAHLSEYETRYGIVVEPNKNISTRFRILIRGIYDKTGKKVVILVDEYDKPLLSIEENPEQFEKNQTLLKGFFSNLKSMDANIQFALITGVARFSKVSIFSDLNNLDDISMENSYDDICGWTESELLSNFHSGSVALAEELEEDFDTTLQRLCGFYDGYLFTPKGSRLYNPYSVLRALKAKEIDPYWFETGTPSFLVKRIKARGTYPPDINGIMCARKELTAVRGT